MNQVNTSTLKGLTNTINFLDSVGIKSHLANLDDNGYARTIEFKVYDQTYQILWYCNESYLKIGTHKRSPVIPFRHIYHDTSYPLVGGNSSLGFSYTKKENVSMFDDGFNYQDFRIPLELKD